MLYNTCMRPAPNFLHSASADQSRLELNPLACGAALVLGLPTAPSTPLHTKKIGVASVTSVFTVNLEPQVTIPPLSREHRLQENPNLLEPGKGGMS